MSKVKIVDGNEGALDKDGIASQLRVPTPSLAEHLKEVYSLDRSKPGELGIKLSLRDLLFLVQCWGSAESQT